ncbi:MAG TPA: class II aldolase/adducin family protein [Spirochaetia bacterium]|nr:class II aldolase/adducin family protein [Spirochaetia bacterium]
MEFVRQREEIVAFGRRMIQRGLAVGTGGNLSIYVRDTGVVLVSPSGMDYDEIELEDVVVLDPNGKVIEGRRRPSTESPMHLAIYRDRTEINAVVHTHSPYATALACLGRGIPPFHYLVPFIGASVNCAPYASFGTDELGLAAVQGMAERKAVLLANHGVLAGDATLRAAFGIAELVEFLSRVYCAARTLDDPRSLPAPELVQLGRKFRNYAAGTEKT